ncbi:hypothetical protein PSCICO_41800 [Pseudomonas cichorii]|nr:hypothetical protein PSCICO_41800 [Pseudomonas cichorii]
MRLLVTDEAEGLEPSGLATGCTTAALPVQIGSDPAGKGFKRLS